MPRISFDRQPVAPYPAQTVAKWFIAWAEAEGEELSNLKLQKLLYYAQGHFLAERQGLLFSDQIQAWSHGLSCLMSTTSTRDAEARLSSYHKMTLSHGMTWIPRRPNC